MSGKLAKVVGYVFIIGIGCVGSFALFVYLMCKLIDMILRGMHAHVAFSRRYKQTYLDGD